MGPSPESLRWGRPLFGYNSPGRCVCTDVECSQGLDAHRVSMEAAGDYDAPRNRMPFVRTAWIEDELRVPKSAGLAVCLPGSIES